MLSSLRHAIRSLRLSPAFAVTVVATLALGIGLNAAIFTVVDCVLLRPLGYHDADRIVALQTRFNDEGRSIPRLGGDDYNDIARQVRGLESTAYYKASDDGIQIDGQAIYLTLADVSPDFMTVMGVLPVAGRNFAASDTAGSNAIVSAGFAREHYGSSQAAVGHTLRYGGMVRPIVGVLPDGFAFPQGAKVWMENKPAPANGNRTSYSEYAVAKRSVGVSQAQLSAELATFSRQLQNAFVEDRHKSIEAIPLQEQIVGSVKPTLALLMGSVAVILLIVCANVTHLQLVRATRQMRSITIRTALGASRWVLAGRALLEASLLAIAGCAFAIALAMLALKLLVRMAPPDIPLLREVHLNLDVLLFSFLLSSALMATTAVLPVWRFWRLDPASALRQDASRGTESRGTARLRSGFLVAEIALTLTLSVSGVVLARQLIQQSREELGFAADNLITMDGHAVDSTAPPTAAQAAALTADETKDLQAQQEQGQLHRLDDSLAQLASVPGVQSAAAMQGAPMGFSGSGVGYAIKGRQVFAPPYEGLPYADVRPVTPGALGTLGIPLLRGRGLTGGDTTSAPNVALINAELAREVFGRQNPIGQEIACGYDDRSTWTIVGVVGDVHADSPGSKPSPTFYVPLAQHPGQAQDVQLLVRTKLAPVSLIDLLQRKLKTTHPEIAVKATTMRENMGETQRWDEFRSLLFGSFAFVSILLAAVGMYGVTAYSVAQRRYEFGLRFALGAQRGQVLRMVLGNALRVTAVGVVLGIGLSLGLMRVLSSVLGKLPGFDLTAYALAIFAVLMIALFATLIPARRASTIDPMTVLRSE
jgi:putative ABC transport system permease protein